MADLDLNIDDLSETNATLEKLGINEKIKQLQAKKNNNNKDTEPNFAHTYEISNLKFNTETDSKKIINIILEYYQKHSSLVNQRLKSIQKNQLKINDQMKAKPYENANVITKIEKIISGGSGSVNSSEISNIINESKQRLNDIDNNYKLNSNTINDNYHDNIRYTTELSKYNNKDHYIINVINDEIFYKLLIQHVDKLISEDFLQKNILDGMNHLNTLDRRITFKNKNNVLDKYVLPFTIFKMYLDKFIDEEFKPIDQIYCYDLIYYLFFVYDLDEKSITFYLENNDQNPPIELVNKNSNDVKTISMKEYEQLKIFHKFKIENLTEKKQNELEEYINQMKKKNAEDSVNFNNAKMSSFINNKEKEIYANIENITILWDPDTYYKISDCVNTKCYYLLSDKILYNIVGTENPTVNDNFNTTVEFKYDDVTKSVDAPSKNKNDLYNITMDELNKLRKFYDAKCKNYAKWLDENIKLDDTEKKKDENENKKTLNAKIIKEFEEFKKKNNPDNYYDKYGILKCEEKLYKINVSSKGGNRKSKRRNKKTSKRRRRNSRKR